jgi:hypothetical protein
MRHLRHGGLQQRLHLLQDGDIVRPIWIAFPAPKTENGAAPALMVNPHPHNRRIRSNVRRLNMAPESSFRTCIRPQNKTQCRKTSPQGEYYP